jgi:GNAT superfamily N-acetyltransferase
VYRHARGFESFFNHLLPLELGERLLAVGPTAAFIQPHMVRELISAYYRPCKSFEEVFWSGYFEYQPGPVGLASASQEKDAWVIKVDGQVVSQAVSVRQNELSAEVYVETHPDFRRKGYGRQATAAWARDTLISGRVPFYSYERSNSASAALAKSLRVRWFADVVVFEPA